MSDLSNELLQPCKICKKRWRRKDYKEWSYVDGILACNSHKGVKEWYAKALAEVDETWDKNNI